MSQTTIWRILVIVAAALLLIGNAAFWVDQHLADETAFTDATFDELKGEEAREAIAEEIVFAIMGNQPLVYQIARQPAEVAVTRLLATQPFEPLLAQIANDLHKMVVNGEDPAITIGTAFLPPIVTAIISAIGPGPLFTFEDQEIQIRLFASQDVPSLEWLVDPLQQVGLLCGLVGIVILALSVVVASDWRLGLRRVAIAIGGVAIITLVAIVPLRRLYLSQVDGDAAEAITPGVMSTLTSPLMVQTLLLLIPAAILFALSFRWRPAMATAPVREV